MKIVISYFNGSRQENGSTQKVINNLLTKFEKKMNRHELLINDLSENFENVNFCEGCMSCFFTGECSLHDSMDERKQRLINSDLIILASPIYLGTISSTMKLFLDRLAHWSHLFPLLGKRCVLVIVGQNKGVDDTIKYLYEVASHFGLEVIGTIGIRKNDVKSNLFAQIDNSIDRYYRILYYQQVSYPNEYQRLIFGSFKEMYTQNFKVGNQQYECDYWKQNGYLESELEEILEKKSYILYKCNHYD